jgi:hypothetical protein
LVSNHILMNKIHLIHQYKPTHPGIHKIGFEYAQGYNSFDHIYN